MDSQGAWYGLTNVYNLNHFIKRVKRGALDIYGYI
jgi:hypothetical protein